MVDSSRFSEALSFGKRAEDVIIDALSTRGFCKRQDDRARYDFQFIYNNQTHRVEVKNEDRYADSGNICIEVQQGFPPRAKPSGVAFSEATLFIHTLCESCVVYRRRDMVVYLREQESIGKLRRRSFGDNNNKGFIVPTKRLYSLPWFDYLPTNKIAESRVWNE